MSPSLLYRFLLGLLCAASAMGAPVEIVPSDFRGAVQPQVTVAPNGRIHVVFGKEDAIYHASSTDGVRFDAPVKVGTLEKLALGMRRGPRVTATNDLVLVAAISRTDGMLHTWLSRDGGKAWSVATALNGVPTSAREGLHALAGDGHGRVAAAWLDLRSGRMELWGRMSADGGQTWQPETMIYAAPDGPICQCCHPSLAFGPSGTLAAMWRNSLGGSRDLWLATSTDSGRTFHDPHKLGTGTWPLNACPMDGGSVTFEASGKPIAAWRRVRTIFASDSVNAEQPIAENAAQPVIAAGHNGRWLVWEENGELKKQHNAEPPSSLSGSARAASLATLPDGRVFVAWENTATGAAPVSAEILP